MSKYPYICRVRRDGHEYLQVRIGQGNRKGPLEKKEFLLRRGRIRETYARAIRWRDQMRRKWGLM